jgi:hypothetical protein
MVIFQDVPGSLFVVFRAWLLGLNQFATRAAAGVRFLTGEIGNAHVQVKEMRLALHQHLPSAIAFET